MADKITKYRLIKDFSPGDMIRGILRQCEVCGEKFIARVNQRFCSKKCKQKAHRERVEK